LSFKTSSINQVEGSDFPYNTILLLLLLLIIIMRAATTCRGQQTQFNKTKLPSNATNKTKENELNLNYSILLGHLSLTH
jgi:hypothetical protein